MSALDKWQELVRKPMFEKYCQNLGKVDFMINGVGRIIVELPFLKWCAEEVYGQTGEAIGQSEMNVCNHNLNILRFQYQAEKDA